MSCESIDKPDWIFLNTFHYHETNKKKRIFLFKKCLFYVDFNDCRFLDSQGRVWVPNKRNFLSDGGSIPWPFSVFLRRDEYMPAYAFHDDGCAHGGLIQIGETDAGFVELSRKELDDLLIEMIRALPNCDKVDYRLIYWGVRIGAKVGIGKKKGEAPKNPAHQS